LGLIPFFILFYFPENILSEYLMLIKYSIYIRGFGVGGFLGLGFIPFFILFYFPENVFARIFNVN